MRAYEEGAQIMGEIAAELGGDRAMLRFLGRLHAKRAFRPFSTEEFIDDVMQATESKEIGRRLRAWLFS